MQVKDVSLCDSFFFKSLIYKNLRDIKIESGSK